jgi:tetratricopeptide (TPR) repeat protein
MAMRTLFSTMSIEACAPHLRRHLPVVALLAIIAALGCGGDDGGGSKPDLPATAAEYTERGWERFESGNFDGALSDFDAALGLNGNYGPAYLGQGWARLSLATSSASMQLATASFDSAVAHGGPLPECLSGRAAAYLGVGGNEAYISAISDALLALQLAPDFVFAHRASFDATDLKLISAFSYAAQSHFPAALASANQVEDSGILQEDSETWVVDAVTYSSFEGAVLALLQKLSDEHAG